VDYINFLPVRVDGRTAAVIAYSVAEDRPVSLALEEGNPDTVRRGLKSGHVVLGTALAHRLGRRVGDTVQIETRQGSKEFVIAGTASEYTGGGMAFYMEWHTAQRAFDLQGVHAILATARTGARDELGMRLREFTQKHGLLLQTNAQVHQTLGKQLQGFLGFLWVLLSLVFVVASLGVVNTLTMNVMEQTREFGVLRAIGMKRRQIGKLILTQALALGIISLAPGVVAGVALAYLVNLVTYPLIGHAVPFELSAWHVAGCFGTALAIAVAAALLPARRAARLGVVQALQYE
jgi:putative ABC transport system permease protein